MTTTTESPKYPVAIPVNRLRQPLDITAVTNLAPDAACIIRAWMNTHRPGWNPGAIDPFRLARYGNDITLPVLHFLMNFYDLLTDPWEHKDDDFFPRQMTAHNIGYEDIAILPEAMDAGG